MKLPLRLPGPESRRFDAVGFGLNSLDLLAVVPEHPAPNSKHRLEDFAEMPGGEAATAMVACARQGFRARYVGSVGSNLHGDMVADALRREGVDVSAMRRVIGATNQMAVILVEPKAGNRTVLWSRDPRLAMTPADVDVEAVTSGRVLMVDAHDTTASTAAAAAARNAHIPTVLDTERVRPHIDDLMRQIDVLIVAETFPAAFPGASSMGEGLRKLDEQFRPALVVVTLGAEGSLARCGGTEIRTPALPVTVIDPTGAGDAFRGGFIAGWLRYGPDASVDTLLEYANAVAGCNCLALGAQAGLPTREQLDRVTRERRDRSK